MPSVTGPVGLIPEKTRAIGSWYAQPPPPAPVVCGRGSRAERRGRPRLTSYLVHTPVFDGPFDLLLHLITKEQVDLYEVSLAGIVDAYLAELEHMGRMDLDTATEFLLIAATLIELKTRRLLPGRDDVDIDEELWLLEERDLLLSRLLECKTFKDASAALVRLMAKAERSLPRLAGLEERFLAVMPDLLEGVTPTTSGPRC